MARISESQHTIAAATDTLAGVSEATTDGVQQISTAVGELSRMSLRLQELVATFRY